MKKRNRQIYKFEFVFIFLLIAVVVVSFRPDISGYLPAASFRQNLDIELSQSQVFHLKSTDGNDVRFSSFSISGEIIGEGYVSIYLDNGEERLLVFSNVKQMQSFGLPITGLIAGSKSEDQGLAIESGNLIKEFETAEGETFSGAFIDKCEETCRITPFFYRSEYDLVVLIEPGTKLRITDIVYVVI